MESFMPHGHCFFWMPHILWPTVIADITIGIVYCTLAFSRIWGQKMETLILFRAFIFCCGISHFFMVWNIWNADYRAEMLWSVVTAAVSVAALILIVKNKQAIITIRK
jgi:hypothetical protein